MARSHCLSLLSFIDCLLSLGNRNSRKVRLQKQERLRHLPNPAVLVLHYFWNVSWLSSRCLWFESLLDDATVYVVRRNYMGFRTRWLYSKLSWKAANIGRLGSSIHTSVCFEILGPFQQWVTRPGLTPEINLILILPVPSSEVQTYLALYSGSAPEVRRAPNDQNPCPHFVC